MPGTEQRLLPFAQGAQNSTGGGCSPLHLRDSNMNRHFFAGRAFVVSLHGNNVGVVSADGHLHKVLIGLTAVCGIQSTPTEPRDVNLTPGMRSLRADQ